MSIPWSVRENYKSMKPLELKSPKEVIEFGGKTYNYYNIIFEEDYKLLLERNYFLKKLEKNVCDGKIGGIDMEFKTKGLRIPFMVNEKEENVEKFSDNVIYHCALDSNNKEVEYFSEVDKELKGNIIVYKSGYVCSRYDPEVKGLGMFLRQRLIEDLIKGYLNKNEEVYFVLKAQTDFLKDYYLGDKGYKKFDAYYDDSKQNIVIPITELAKINKM